MMKFQLGELSAASQLVGDLFHSRGLVVVPLDHCIQILGVQTNL